MDFEDPYIIILILSVTIVYIFACCLLAYAVPHGSELKNYRIARLLLATSYIILATSSLYELVREIEPSETSLTAPLTLTGASLQAFFFTFSMITLIDLRFITIRRLIKQFVPIIIFAAALLHCKLNAPPSTFGTVFYIALGYYFVQMMYYVYLFNKEYNRYKHKMDNYFAGDEIRRMRWVKRSFYLALSIGILAVVVLLFLFAYPYCYTCFIAIYTAFYVYFAMKYINYASIFRYTPPNAIHPEVVHDENPVPFNFDNLLQAIDEWTAQKKYTESSITLENLANELGTNRTYLSSYINKELKLSFKAWISRLRIAEAQRLMSELPDIPAVRIGEMVGIADKSSFFRQFMNITGKTPGQFRKQLFVEK